MKFFCYRHSFFVHHRCVAVRSSASQYAASVFNAQFAVVVISNCILTYGANSAVLFYSAATFSTNSFNNVPII